jgi:glycosyltransferase involved in cell wall biosynthesis
MNSSFETDAYPGRPRILFIGPGESTHTHAWIDLLEKEPFNVRLYVLYGHWAPPDDWKVKTYVTGYGRGPIDPATRRRLIDKGRVRRQLDRYLAHARGRTWSDRKYSEEWLARVMRDWRPHIVHAFSLDAADFYFDVRQRYRVGDAAKWVVQVRGGPELALHRLMPEHEARIRRTLSACDQLVADNQQNYDYALAMGVKQSQLSPLGVVPGTGGIDIERLAGSWKGNPSGRRILLWPKAYECHQSKALPVLEALRLARAKLPPCEVHMLAATPEVRMWFQTLPDDVRAGCFLYDRTPRNQALEMMVASRVMLAPSLSDGVPNAMYEAMAAGAFPVVSPIETIRPLVEDGRNVLFARNLYPEEIAAALVRAMTDDALVDEAARRNLELVRRIASRDEVRARVVRFYETLAGGARV